MKTIVALLLAVLATASQAAPVSADPEVQNMYDRCNEVMVAGDCRVALDPNYYGKQKLIRVQGTGGVAFISVESYLKVRNQGVSQNPDGSYKMCTVIPILCPTATTATEDCKAVRYSWRKTSPVEAMVR